jgi:glutamyl-tRNA synthetase
MNHNMEKDNKVVTRFAPSPTGYMHVGNLRTALFSWLWAKKNKGTFILRIEDTDKEREVSGSIDYIIETLDWLGIDYEEGPGKDGPRAPYLQSQRLALYRQYASVLIDKGYAYSDPYSEEEVETFRKKAEENKEAFLYRNHRPKETTEWDGSRPLRFKVPTIKRFEWHDHVYGDLSAGEEALDDFILIKSDGYPTYNFAHIVDDIEMGVTHVMRGQEFIASTPRFLSVYEALDTKPPEFVTLPAIMAEGGKKKLGKRDGAKDIRDYAKEGYLPEAMKNFLALLGWNPGDEREVMPTEDIIEAFDIDRIQKSGAGFDEKKLGWINKEHLKRLSYEEQEEYIEKYISDEIKSLPTYSNEIIHNITPVIIEHITCGADVANMEREGELSYFFSQPSYIKDALFFKSSKIPPEDREKTLASYLKHVIEILSEIGDSEWNKENIKVKLSDYAEKVGRGDIFWPLRYSLSGREKSPDPFLLAEIFGKTETISRIKKAIDILEN